MNRALIFTSMLSLAACGGLRPADVGPGTSVLLDSRGDDMVARQISTVQDRPHAAGAVAMATRDETGSVTETVIDLDGDRLFGMDG